MKWKNLQKNKCPECSRGDLVGFPAIALGYPATVKCSRNPVCTFSIGEEKMKEIIASQLRGPRPVYGDYAWSRHGE